MPLLFFILYNHACMYVCMYLFMYSSQHTKYQSGPALYLSGARHAATSTTWADSRKCLEKDPVGAVAWGFSTYVCVRVCISVGNSQRACI